MPLPPYIAARRKPDERDQSDYQTMFAKVEGAVAAPTDVLIRPDGHVAWVGQGTDHGLRDALATWFGSPAIPDRV